jgi:hypothetical protein
MYHHYKGSNLSRSDYIQRLVIERIIGSPVNDIERDESKIWELKHCSSCVQIGRMLALKRGLNIEIAEVICVLHDIYAIDTGKYKDHALKGAKIAIEILRDTGKYTAEEIVTISSAIKEHSDKQIYSSDPYVELIKDVDVYDCSLYDGTADYYKETKAPEIYKEYMKRVIAVSNELGVPIHPSFII